MNEAVENPYLYFLSNRYFDAKSKDPTETYWNLFRILQRTEFVWVVDMDENRADDGKDLRRQFLLLANIPDQPEWREEPASVLEVLVAFSRRCEEAVETPAKDWFWEMLHNLDLDELSDAVEIEPYAVQGILDQWMARDIDDHGNGGLFPLNMPKRDQRGVDIWYQFCDYIVDQGRLP